ncbi:GNAT family N-acetyltransferase [Ammoniphilus sp. CFH 90114]|uniref:GNAT family N-acetyltransferase n=1 Tax=Ammoniphilus sp. CFH 90114 TaxID=2493665 RepID=UPI00100FEB6C|nr:GNAT family N-acetyltransferase [Ammoniphilus sp. CFH 90114]RXT06377.1 N-acetyltransferase [Ammoniphilus sp. CFH 90114]
MSINLNLIREEDAEEILEFELENRSFFSSIIPDRGDEYFSLHYLNRLLKEIVSDQHNGKCFMYLIRNEEQKLVGRINLFSVVRDDLQKAELGYRIGKRCNGRGYATKAVNLVIHEAFSRNGLRRLEAATDPDNIGSQIVLIKNKFQFVGRTPQYIRVNSEWKDSIHFSLLNPNR